ncbi:hypothetical protein DVN49_15250, partial [Shigella flexneri]|nr:hypothetical protein [Shigella flexneri]EFY1714743.1 hypothetical protein [Shigella flexneri]EGE4075898.1 hypothetical protein [Shigella flexneri]
LDYKDDDGIRTVINPYNKIQKTTEKKKKKKKNNRHYLTKNITVSVYITDLYSGVAGLHYSREG